MEFGKESQLTASGRKKHSNYGHLLFKNRSIIITVLVYILNIMNALSLDMDGMSAAPSPLHLLEVYEDTKNCSIFYHNVAKNLG